MYPTPTRHPSAADNGESCDSVSFKIKKVSRLSGTRNLYAEDIDLVRSLVRESAKCLFGHFAIADIINKTFISLGLENELKELVAAIFLNNYPNISSIPSWEWTPWIQNLYGLNNITPENTLFVHLALFKEDYAKVFLKHILKHVFERCPKVNHIFFIVPPHAKFTEWIEAASTQIKPTGHNSRAVQTLHMFLRQNYVHKYKMRLAVMEDNDDIVELINTHSKRLQACYGEFYVAELVNDHNRKIVVAEYDGNAVAVMCFNTKVNSTLVNEQFELETFYGLRKPNFSDRKQTRSTESEHVIKPDSDSEDSVDDSVEMEETTSIIEQQQSEESIHDLERAAGKISLDVISIEEEVEEESVVECEMMYAGYADPRFSINQLNFSDDELELWKRYRRKRSSCIYNVGSIRATETRKQGPSYAGEPNTFTLELAAAWPEHELALPQLLEASFQLYNEKDYCVLCTPSTAPAFDLQSNVFVRVPQRCNSTFPHELYVVHRSAVCGEIVVRLAMNHDLHDVHQFLKGCYTGETVFESFREGVLSIDNLYYQGYVILCDGQLIGCAVVLELQDLDYLESHYQIANYTDISSHKSGCLGQLKYVVLSPIFERHSRYILLELHRITDYSFLYYKLSPFEATQSNIRPICCILGTLMPVMPIEMPQYNVMLCESWSLPEALGKVKMPFAVYINTPACCGIGRVEINDKIVVVGASNTGLSFLVSLAFQKNPNCRVTFNNITLVSTHGIQIHKSNMYRAIMIPQTSDIDGYYLSLISLSTYVNIIKGVMTAIDRVNKRIIVNNSRLPYDLLFLTCGKQFQVVKRLDERRFRYEYPENVFVINTPEDVDTAIEKLEKYRAKNSAGQVVIYGYKVEAYCTVASMLDFGFQPNQISFVISVEDVDFEPHITAFNDPDIDDAIKNTVSNAGVNVYEGYIFYDWTFDSRFYRISHIKFESKTKVMELHCMAVFMYAKKDVSEKTFLAVNRANLIYDGALVIDPNFRTNDPNIYAAGTMTKYPRRYYADHMVQAYFNQTEVGSKLANAIAEKILPPELFFREKSHIFDKYSTPSPMLVPRYLKPLKIHARLPGGVEYFTLRRPGLPIPYHVMLTSDDYGQLLTTGNPLMLDLQGYFKLHLNQYCTVETVTCLSKSQIETVNLSHVWGKHERLLNNLVKRFEMAMIDDLYAFFASPWMYALYHDRFDKLNNDIMEMMMSLTEEDGNSLIEDLLGMFHSNKWRTLTREQRQEIKAKFRGSVYESRIEKKVLDFLQDNFLYLPMYATPFVCTMVLGAYSDSPLFKPT